MRSPQYMIPILMAPPYTTADMGKGDTADGGIDRATPFAEAAGSVDEMPAHLVGV